MHTSQWGMGQLTTTGRARAGRGRRRARTGLALAAAMMLTGLPAAGPVSAAHFSDTVELEGDSAVDAAVAWSALAFPDGAEEALLGRDDAFPDSLASGGLQDSRPLLLTATAELSEATAAELERLGVTTVHILGGQAAVSAEVATELEDAGYTVQRYAGPTRVDTAVAVARETAPEATAAILARAFGDEEDESRGFADSLAAGGWAAEAGMPVLLTETAELSEATAAYLQSSAITDVTIVGGNAAVSEATQAQVAALGKTVERVSGPTRFHTATAIATARGYASLADVERVIVTEGQAADGWPSGFAAAALAAADGAPILLANQGELPEPTLAFLTGAGEGEGEGEGEAPAVTLVCSPSVSGEACDAAAEALGKEPIEGGELVEFAITSVPKWEWAEGKVSAPEEITDLRVSGCGYSNEPVYVYPTGEIYVMISEEPGTCTLAFSARQVGRPVNVSVDISVAAADTPTSASQRPEPRSAHAFKQDAEGTHIRFLFSQAIVADSVKGEKFSITAFDGEHNNTPSAAFRDPRNPRAVVVVFATSSSDLDAATFERATLAAVDFGAVYNEKGQESEDGTTNRFFTEGGANPPASFPVKAFDSTQSDSGRPDLVRVGDHDATLQRALFTFSMPVDVPQDTAVGDAVLVLVDGSLIESSANGFSRGPDARSLWVDFSAAGLSAERWENVRRGYVRGEHTGTGTGQKFEGVVNATVEIERTNTPVTAIITGGGLTQGPDLIGFKNVDGRNVTFVFDEEILRPTTNAAGRKIAPQFLITRVNGAVERGVCVTGFDEEGVFGACAAGEAQPSDRRELRVNFGGGDPFVLTRNLYYTVVSGEEQLRGFFSDLPAREDTIRNVSVQVFPAGTTQAPDLMPANTKLTSPPAKLAQTNPQCLVAEVCEDGTWYHDFAFSWNEDIGINRRTTTVNNNTTTSDWNCVEGDNDIAYHVFFTNGSKCRVDPTGGYFVFTDDGRRYVFCVGANCTQNNGGREWQGGNNGCDPTQDGDSFGGNRCIRQQAKVTNIRVTAGDDVIHDDRNPVWMAVGRGTVKKLGSKLVNAPAGTQPSK